MSAISGTAALSSSLPTSTMGPVDQANMPAVIRNGDTKAKNAYQTGLAFENVLVNELAQQLAATVPGLDGSSSSDDGLGGTSDDSSDSSDAGGTGGVSGGGLGAYSSLLPQTLASSVMSGGGTGIAMQIAKSIDPALGVPQK